MRRSVLEKHTRRKYSRFCLGFELFVATFWRNSRGRELTFATVSAVESGQRRSGPKEGGVGGWKITARKQKTGGVFTDVLHPQARTGDRRTWSWCQPSPEYQLQHLQIRKNKRCHFSTETDVTDVSNLNRFLYSRWHFIATVISMLILIFLSRIEQNVKTAACHNYGMPVDTEKPTWKSPYQLHTRTSSKCPDKQRTLIQPEVPWSQRLSGTLWRTGTEWWLSWYC